MLAKIKNKFRLKIDPKEDLITLGTMLALCLVQGLVINGFYVPNSFLSGGITGISLLFNYLWGLPSWLCLLVLNMPIAILGIIHLDLKFALFSALGTVLFSFSIAVTSFIKLPAVDPILAALTGGVILGVSGAPVVRRGATFGGMDVVAMFLSRKYSIPMGNFNIIFNLIIMTVLGIIYGLELAILSMLAMFVANVAFNNALVGMNKTHAVFIISNKSEEIVPDIMHLMKRGATYIPTTGAFTGIERKLIYCIVRTVELSKLKSIVLSHDPNALFSVINTREVIGRGFGAIN